MHGINGMGGTAGLRQTHSILDLCYLRCYSASAPGFLVWAAVPSALTRGHRQSSAFSNHPLQSPEFRRFPTKRVQLPRYNRRAYCKHQSEKRGQQDDRIQHFHKSLKMPEPTPNKIEKHGSDLLLDVFRGLRQFPLNGFRWSGFPCAQPLIV